MLVQKGDLFDMVGKCDAICITTNGYVKADGSNIMGAGIALEAKNRFSKIEYMLGSLIKRNGNIVQGIINVNQTVIMAVPTKPVSKIATSLNDIVPHMRGKYVIGMNVIGCFCMSTVEIITKSINELVAYADTYNYSKVCLPMLGCSNGGLNRADILPIMEKLLDDRFILIVK